MKKLHYVMLFSFIVLAYLPGSLSGQKKASITMPEGYVGMIGYGSLMSLKSMEQTLGHEYVDSAYQVHLKGFVRTWTSYRLFDDPMVPKSNSPRFYGFILQDNDSIPIDGIVQLNVENKKRSRINCILYLISEEDLVNFDKREYGYNRIDVTDKIDEYNIIGNKVYIYQQPHGYYDKTLIDKCRFVLVKEYVDMITKACDEIGEDFRREFDRSTLPSATQIIPSNKIAWKTVK